MRVPVAKAPITLSNADVVVMRGSASHRRRFLEELAAALEPYQRDDFADAERRLRDLHRARPDSPEVSYYLGVSLLMLDRPADAVEPLRRAARGRDASTASYYLAVAQVNAGDGATGVAALRRLCDGRTELAEAACAALTLATGGHD